MFTQGIIQKYTTSAEVPLSVGKQLGNGKDTVHYLDHSFRMTHMHILGSTGVGKSKFIEHMIRSDMLQGHGLCLIDPHGDLYSDLMKFAIEHSLYDRVIPFDPTHDSYVVGYNPIACIQSANVDVKAKELREACGKVWGVRNWDETPRLARWLYNIFYVLVEQKLTMLDALALAHLSHTPKRAEIVRKIQNPSIKKQFQDLEQMKPHEIREQLESSFNRLSEFLNNTSIARIFSQTHTLDIKKAMNEGKIILCNFSTKNGKLSASDRNLLGTLFIHDFYTIALTRNKKERTPFYFYIDEFAHFLSLDIAQGLAETRKFGLGYVLAHQYLSQLKEYNEVLYQSVMTNTRIKMVFGGLTDEDREILTKELFAPDFDVHTVKDEVYQTKLKPKLELRTVHSTGENATFSNTTSKGYSDSESSGIQKAVSISEQSSTTKNTSLSIQNSVSQSLSTSSGSQFSQSIGTSFSNSDGKSTQKSVSHGTSSQWSKGNSESTSQGTTLMRGSSQGESITYGTSSSETHSEHQSTTHGRNSSETTGYGYSDSYSDSYSSSESYSESQSNNSSYSDSYGTSESTTHSKSTTEGDSHSSSEQEAVHDDGSVSRNTSDSYGNNSSNTQGRSDTVGNSHTSTIGGGSSFSSSSQSSRSQSRSTSHSDSRNFSSTQGSSFSESFGTGRADTKGTSFSKGNSIQESTSYGTSQNKSIGSQSSYSEGKNSSETTGESISSQITKGTQESITQGESFSKASTQGNTHAQGTTEGFGISQGQGKSIQQGQNFSTTQSNSFSTAQGTSQGRSTSSSETWVTVQEEYKELSSRTYYSLEEQTHMAKQMLSKLSVQQAVIKVHHYPPITIQPPTIAPCEGIKLSWYEGFLRKVSKNNQFLIPVSQAVQPVVEFPRPQQHHHNQPKKKQQALLSSTEQNPSKEKTAPAKLTGEYDIFSTEV